MQLIHHDRYDYSPIFERPQFDWPNGKQLALYVALNVEHFNFGSGLGHTPTVLGPPPDVRNFAWRDYGLRVGIWRIFDLMDELGLPLCHLLNAAVCEHFPQIVDRIRRRRDEVVGHGYTNSERQSEMNESTETEMISEGDGDSRQSFRSKAVRLDGTLDRRNLADARPFEGGRLQLRYGLAG